MLERRRLIRARLPRRTTRQPRSVTAAASSVTSAVTQSVRRAARIASALWAPPATATTTGICAKLLPGDRDGSVVEVGRPAAQIVVEPGVHAADRAALEQAGAVPRGQVAGAATASHPPPSTRCRPGRGRTGGDGQCRLDELSLTIASRITGESTIEGAWRYWTGSAGRGSRAGARARWPWMPGGDSLRPPASWSDRQVGDVAGRHELDDRLERLTPSRPDPHALRRSPVT